MAHCDTSAVIASLSGSRSRWRDMLRLLESGGRPQISSLVQYEWTRGRRTASEIRLQRRLFPETRVIPFTHLEAELSAEFYRALPRARARAIDFGIAACAIIHNAPLWTLNQEDFEDIPGLRLVGF